MSGRSTLILLPSALVASLLTAVLFSAGCTREPESDTDSADSTPAAPSVPGPSESGAAPKDVTAPDPAPDPDPDPDPRAADPAEAATGPDPASRDVGPSASADAEPPARLIETAPGVRVDLVRRLVQLDAEVCIEAGWLEQVACTPGTREHESLVSITAQPRDVHAALLLLGLEPGRPGSWRVEEGRLVEIPPAGAPVTIRVRRVDAGGATVVEPIERWVRDAARNRELPPTTWLFAGSLLVPMKSPAPAPDATGAAGARPSEAPLEPDATGVHASLRYLADSSGSVVGLVTFGDEVLAFPTVISDSESVHAPELEAWSERLPPMGTPVLLEIVAVPRNDAAASEVGAAEVSAPER